jgi:hypothetical protein
MRAWKWIPIAIIVVLAALALLAYGYVHDWGCNPNEHHELGDRCYVR